MNIVQLFVLVSLPAGISIILLLINRNKLDNIYSKYYDNFISKQFLSIPLRIFKLLMYYQSLTKDEKETIILAFISILIFYLSFITWAVFTLLFPYLIFSN
jgi:hypothetical protein